MMRLRLRHAGRIAPAGGLRPRSNNVSVDNLENNDEYTGSSRTELSPEIVQQFQVVNKTFCINQTRPSTKGAF
jgi:hypothetical protein